MAGPGGNSRFRSSFTYVEGHVPAIFLMGKVVNVNMTNWTVDVCADYDSKRYFDIQVSSPYLHHSNGEGIYVVPEVGAKCMVCIPSDSSPPYVSSFVAVSEAVDTVTAETPKGVAPSSNGSGERVMSFSGGRPRANPGDIWMRTRDDNFVVLHRGGVLQIGATELAQRIYIPLRNYIMDVSQNYIHHNAGGSESWGLRESTGVDHFETEHWQTFRVYADNKFADIRIKTGKVSGFQQESPAEYKPQLEQLGIKEEDPSEYIVTEVIIAPDGFNPETGAAAESAALAGQTKMRFFFNRGGGMFMKCEGGILLATKKRFKIIADGGFEFQTDKDFTIIAGEGMTLGGGAFTHIKGDLVKLSSGATPVAIAGSLVTTLVGPGALTMVPFSAYVSVDGVSYPVMGGSVMGTTTGVVTGNTSTTVLV